MATALVFQAKPAPTHVLQPAQCLPRCTSRLGNGSSNVTVDLLMRFTTARKTGKIASYLPLQPNRCGLESAAAVPTLHCA